MEFRNLEDENEFDLWESMREAVDFELADSPYNICSNCANEISYHENFAVDNVK